MADPIKELAVQSLGQPGPQPVPGFEFNPVDLNKGVGGNFIYIGWQRGPVNDNPVTQIDFEAFREIQNVNPRGDWEWNQLDLNAGAHPRIHPHQCGPERRSWWPLHLGVLHD